MSNTRGIFTLRRISEEKIPLNEWVNLDNVWINPPPIPDAGYFTGGSNETAIDKTSYTTDTTARLPGADLDVSARRLIWGKGINAGQTCIAPDHLLVDPSLKGDLLSCMDSARTAMYGEDPLESDQLGQIINRRQFERLAALLDTARADGRILIGGEISPDQQPR